MRRDSKYGMTSLFCTSVSEYVDTAREVWVRSVSLINDLWRANRLSFPVSFPCRVPSKVKVIHVDVPC